MNEQEFRYWCPLMPCCPCDPQVVNGRLAHLPQVAGSRSFATSEAYDRHMRAGHFLRPEDAPQPVYARRGGAR